MQKIKQEIFSIFSWATPDLFGKIEDYRAGFSNPIEAGRQPWAVPGAVQLGEVTNKELQGMIRPHFLQRLKTDHLRDKLPPKTDIVVWTNLSADQHRMYAKYLEDNSRFILTKGDGAKGKVLAAISHLKKLCGHPCLVDETGTPLPELDDMEQDLSSVITSSSKLGVLSFLTSKLCEEGHRVLIFSQSTKMLEIMKGVLCQKNINVSVIDGSVSPVDRLARVDRFNDAKSNAQVMLLSTKAGGVGLTLTGADRVIVYDPSWTPAEDAQAVDRCYRISQTRPVVVFRLITAGTVESAMYETQVYKDGIRRQLLEDTKDLARHYSRNSPNIFKLGDTEDFKKKFEKNSIVSNEYRSILNHKGVVWMSCHDGFYGENTSTGSSFNKPSTSPLRTLREKDANRQNAVPLGKVPRKKLQKKQLQENILLKHDEPIDLVSPSRLNAANPISTKASTTLAPELSDLRTLLDRAEVLFDQGSGDMALSLLHGAIPRKKTDTEQTEFDERLAYMLEELGYTNEVLDKMN